MTKTEHLKNIRNIAADGMVLLENNGILPLKKDTGIAAFGSTMYFCNKGGCGSGDVLSVIPVQPYDALVNCNISVNKEIADLYISFLENDYDWELKYYNRHNVFANPELTWMQFIDEPQISEDMFVKAANTSDVAVVSIGRNIGEHRDFDKVKGSYYLNDQEIGLLTSVKKHFKKAVLVLNTAIVIDPVAIKGFGFDAVLYASFGGSEMGNSLVDILFGNVTPSGKLAATVADINDFPTNENFGELTVPYNEGIYVGYRYFDSFNIQPVYPFGYGLSYTTFDITYKETIVSENKITVKADVKNTGAYNGKEVIQLYISEPDGKLEKAYQQLAAFAKTGELKPNENQEVSLTFDLCDFACFDQEAAEFILEKGTYYLRLGNSSRNTKIVSGVELNNTACCFKTHNRCTLKTKLNLITKTAFYSYALEQSEKDSCQKYQLDTNCIKAKEPVPLEEKVYNNVGFFTIKDLKEGKCTIENFVAQFNEVELADLLNGATGATLFPGLNVGCMAKKIPGAAGEIWSSDKYGIDANVNADGPTGIRLGSFYVDFKNVTPDSDLAKSMNAYPVATLVANTWDLDNANLLGAGVSSDMSVCNVDGWLAPGMNIQRNPLCGRNFEYYSEDPLLTGKMAAATVNGIQKDRNGENTKHYATIKHFVANNVENNRLFSDSVVSERALREIYLKGFKIAVDESSPYAIMNSYSKLNGEYTSDSYDLNTAILREEWGYDGIVMTDWCTRNTAFMMTNAGCDLVMPGEKNKEYLEGLKDGRINIQSARRSAERIIKLLLKTNN